MANTIMIKNRGMIRDEAVCSADVYPGMLLEWDASNPGQVKPHATSGGNAIAMFAIENELYGKNKSTVYSSGERVAFVICRTGDIVLCRIANGQNIVVGNWLESNGDGYMKKSSAYDSSVALEQYARVKLQALEAVDMSDSSAADPDGFCKAMVV